MKRFPSNDGPVLLAVAIIGLLIGGGLPIAEARIENEISHQENMLHLTRMKRKFRLTQFVSTTSFDPAPPNTVLRINCCVGCR